MRFWGICLAALPASPLMAEIAPEARATDEIVVHGRSLPQIGTAISGSQGTVGYRDFEDRPLGRVGELVENVPGVIATQHSGTGKANQYFLRGFNLDHGTDFAGFVDGVPINMRTHGHGQGYLDLNFLIPELVERIDYRKGPYFADVGDFSAAGTVSMTTVDTLPTPMIQVTAGGFGYVRGLAAGSAPLSGGDLLAAIDVTRSDGPWVLDERLRKVNGFAKYSAGTLDHGWELSASGYHATWNATDQIPARAVANGDIPRLGYVDPYLGGMTTRLGLTGNGRFGDTSVNLHATYYRFRLTSNFTYFLDDPVNGDEFQQRDRRGVFGGSIRHEMPLAVAAVPVTLAVGADARFDDIGAIGLYHSERGVRIGTIREDRVREYSGALHAEATARLTSRLRLVAGLRGDLYAHDVHARAIAANGGRGSEGMLSPKLALAWRAADHVEFYADHGEGFHSNDVRGATIAVDPKSGEPVSPLPVLVRARGDEIGARLEYRRFTASVAAYRLSLGSELVFSGDEGTTEPNAASRRRGVEVTLFWKPTDWLTLDGAYAYTHARFRGVEAGEDHIPNAVGVVASGGAELALGHGLSASLRLRHFGRAPLVEDGGARSRPTTLVNLGAYYRLGRARLGVDILNLLDSRANDITYYYASRLPGEPAAGVEDHHFHPVEPRQARVSLAWAF